MAMVGARFTQSEFPTGSVFKTDGIEHVEAAVTNQDKKPPDGAGGLIVAVTATLVEIDACTGHQRNRALQAADDFTERNASWMTGQAIPALGTTDTLDDAQCLEIEHDELEEFARNLLCLRDPGKLDRIPVTFLDQVEKGAKRISRLLGKHVAILVGRNRLRKHPHLLSIFRSHRRCDRVYLMIALVPLRLASPTARPAVVRYYLSAVETG